MRKIIRSICVILSCTMVMSLSGCGFNSLIQTRLKMLNLETINEEKSNLKTTKDILNCFSKKDVKSLKALLCAKTQGLKNIDEQILEGFDFFKGKVTSFNKNDITGYEGDSVENGKKTFLERSWDVEDIKTDEGKTYTIHIAAYIICDNDRNREGISEITIINSNGKELKIGYPWPIYFDDGQDMAYEVIKALSDKDMNGLKTMFCAKTLGITDIEAQIQAGIKFFQGKATMGEVKEGDIVYDGKHDYLTSVSDDEIVKNYKPIRTSISVTNENIETDIGKIYKIEFYAYLLDVDDKASEGISQIIIISDDGRKQVIGKRLS